jgi:hypothetical protein
MQILGGSSANAAASSGAPGGLDPLMAGFSSDGASIGAGADGAGTENPFASELAAALASLEGAAGQPAGDALANQIVVDAAATAQIAAEGALALGSGQNLPLDPAFQSAVLATFAAVNTAVQTDAAAALASMTAEQKAMLTEQELAAMNLAAQTLAAQAAAAQTAADQAKSLQASLDQSLANAQPDFELTPAELHTVMTQEEVLAAATAAAAAEGQTSVDLVAAQGVQQDVGLSADQDTSVTQSSVSMTQVVTNIVNQNTNGTQTSAQVSAANEAQVQSASAAAAAAAAVALAANTNVQTAQDKTGQTSAKPVAVDANQVVNAEQAAADSAVATGETVLDIAVSEKPSVSKTPVAQAHLAATDATKAADAARVAVPADADEAPVAQVVTGNQQVTDIGNVLVTAKANADGIAAAGDAARQSAQRIDGATGVSAAQSAEAAAVRAESRLEAARASLGSGPLNVEVLKLTRQGGGRAVLEVTPPNQGPIRLDLQLDGAGRASLVVEGLTESMKARLESSAHFLRQDMAQMGLALNLEMRERNDSNPSAQSFAQGFGQSGQGSNQRSSSAQSGSATSGQEIGNLPGARKSNVVEDGVHLVA